MQHFAVYKTHVGYHGGPQDGVIEEDFAIVVGDYDDKQNYKNAIDGIYDITNGGVTMLHLEEIGCLRDGVIDEAAWNEIGIAMGWKRADKPKPLSTAVYDENGNEVFSKDWD